MQHMFIKNIRYVRREHSKMEIKTHGPPKPVITPLGITSILVDKPVRATEISYHIHRIEVMKCKIKSTDIYIKEMKKEFKALYHESWESYVKRNNQDTK